MTAEAEPKSRLRDDLIRRAKLGEITPGDAESEAMLFDCGPLEVRLESLDRDPWAEDDWSLLMALVWIIERDASAVRAVWIKAGDAVTHWVGSPLAESDGTGAAKSWELKPLDRLTVTDVDYVVYEEAGFMFPPFIVGGVEARGALLANLRSGRLPARGKRYGTSERQAIPKSDWTDLDWLNDPTAPADTVGGRTENAPKYDEVSVSGQRVREIWPPLDDVQSEEFEREDWSADHAILWVAYRNPALFHFVGLTGPRAQAQFLSAEPRDASPRKTLLEALKTDKLRAIRSGQKISPEHWFGSRLPRWQPEATRIYFRRSDVMRIFKDKPLVAKAKSPIDRGKAESGPPNETSATVHGRVEPTNAAVNDLAEDSVRGASTNVVARESERPPRKRTQRQRDRVKKVFEEFYPGGVPDDVLPKELHDKVVREFEQRKWSEVSIDTVSRAAGRREDLAKRKSHNA